MRKGIEFLIPVPDILPGIIIDIIYQQYITIMIISCNEEKIRPLSLPLAVGSVSPISCPRPLKGYASQVWAVVAILII